MKNNRRLALSESKGFTLVELLVVISIVAILATIGIASFSVAQQSARDGKAKADVTTIAKSIESSRDMTINPITYTYTTTNLSADFKVIPAGSNAAYCVRGDNSAIGDLSATDTTWTKTVCPANWGVVNTSTSNLPSNHQYWKVCAKLERGTPNPFCVSSIAQ